MKRELSGGITSRKRFAGKSDFSAKQVSTTFLLLLLCLLMPQGLKAQSVDGLTANETYDFAALAQQSTTINWGDDYTGFTDNSPKYMGDINGTSLQGRFATGTKSGQGWFLRTDRTPIGLWGRKKLAFCGMWNGDRVRVTLAQGGIKFLEANSAKMNGSLVTEGQTVNTGTFVFAAARNGDVIIECTDNYTTITKVEFFYSGNGFSGSYSVSFNESSVSLDGGQTYDTNNANVSPSWATPVFTSSNESVATVNENGIVTALGRGTATITAKLDVGPEGAEWSQHSTAQMTVNVTSTVRLDKYSYDPAIEIYDLSGISTGNATNSENKAGYQTSGQDAYIMGNPYGYSLNNRLAVSINNFTWDNGLKTTLGNNQWSVLSINNLKADDRVVITYSGTTMEFGSHHTDNTQFAAANNVYRDDNNNGEHENYEPYVEAGNSVESGTVYTMEQDGHLDIRVPGGAIITKIEIYSDHQARMVDEINTTGLGGRSYFDTTGQLEAKHHIVPGGLHVYVGNDNDAQHAEVIASDEGYVSYVLDEAGYKPARHNTYGSFTYNSELPVNGTYYRFVPDVNGTVTVKFKAKSVNYSNWFLDKTTNTPSNELQSSVACPYYFAQAIDGKPSTVFGPTSKGNDATVTMNNITVTAGNTYYLYGWWPDGTDGSNFGSRACGVAELIDVTFVPEKGIYPLAKWVDSGATSATDLADVVGYTTSNLFIKKKSDNIESATVSISGGKLNINNITYKDGTNPGGVILVKLGDRYNDADPVFVLTIAYDAGFNPVKVGEEDGNDIIRCEGYSWNFSDKSLKALQWNDRNAEADVVDFGTRFNGFASAAKDDNGVPTNGVNSGSFLSYEIDQKGDWTFNYRVKKNGTFYDPRFLNNYDMEGDNADMMWDTQGIIINAGSQQSCIFNEHGVDIDHSNKTQADPDRYVGFLEGGSFIIPKLKKDDRVIIYMGSGNGSGSQAMKFKITNALDAMHNPIDPADEYFAGGSQWNTIDNHKDPYYRGCYHFYAADDGDMEFKMVGGSMCKLYSIKIYSGEREETNAVQENGNGYTILATKDQEGNVTTATNSWNLHYRGKGETIADGNGKFSQINEIIASSATITHNANTDLVRVGNQGVSYTNQGEIGMLRIRVKCMEYNHNYVTDFSDRNITLALHETKAYPYTWDFTDMKGWEATKTDIATENTNYVESDADYETKGRDISIWDESGAMILYGPTWGYVNQNMLFENSKGIDGNQLWANDKVIPETQGLWFYMDNNDASYNGSMQITDEGLRLANTRKMQADGTTNLTMGWWNYKMVVPNVPNGAAVYLRMKRDPNVADGDYSQKPNEDPVYFLSTKFHFGTDNKTDLTPINNGTATYPEVINSGNYSFYKVAGSTDEWILAVKNNKGAASNLTFTLNGWILEKMAVSKDFKKVNKFGWATESRARVIDPALTSEMTGYPFKNYIVTSTNLDAKKVVLEEVDANSVIPISEDADKNAYIIRNNYDTETATGEEPGRVKILNDGFHLFVPDMHDYVKGSSNNQKTLQDVSGNLLKAKLSSGTVNQTDNGFTNYVLTTEVAHVDADGNNISGSDKSLDYVGFFKVQKNGVTSSGNQAYLPVESGNLAKLSISFFAEISPSDEDMTTGLNKVETSLSEISSNAVYYNLNGQKLDGKPTEGGIYIVNGKKVVVK